MGVSVVDDLVRAIIRGDKLETRRPLHRAPQVKAGDELYVRECWAPMLGREYTLTLAEYEGGQDPAAITYRTDERPPNPANNDPGLKHSVLRWYPAIHMPKWAARIFLPLVEVRDEPLHEITDEGVKREGIAPVRAFQGERLTDEEFAKWGYRLGFRSVWDGLYGKTMNDWTMNPMVRVYRWEKARILC